MSNIFLLIFSSSLIVFFGYLENRYDQKKASISYVYLLTILFFCFRVYVTGNLIYPVVSIISFLLTFPVYIKHIFLKKDFSIKTFLTYLLPVFVHELYLLTTLKQWNLKKEINSNSPEPLSDTDEKLLLASNTLLSFCTLFLFAGLENFKIVFIVNFLPIVGILYFKTAIEKIKLNWIKINRLDFINKAAHKQLNWYLFKNKNIETMLSFSFIAFFLEFFSIFFLITLDPFLILCVLTLLCVFHLLVFILTGINFWKWILSNIAGIIITCGAINLLHGIDLNLTLIPFLLTSLYFYFVSNIPIGLGWLDSPVSKVFKVYLIGKNNKELMINPFHIFPYDTILSQNRLNYLFPEVKYISGCLGAIKDPALCHFLYSISDEKNEKEAKEIVKNIISQYGSSPDLNSSNLKAQKLLNFFIQNQFIEEKIYFKKIFSHIQSRFDFKKEKSDNITDIEKIKITFDRFFYSKKEKKYIKLDSIEKIIEVRF